MATLVLTAVGGVIGGPIGAAIGSALGQVVDRTTLFAPGRREGPRLTELAVQTSSYGSAIPRLFGTMRVAGTVIWATDLVETRGTSRAGKGQPSVTNYSYSASFAVALSSRRIVAVRRIWADGKLLRGAAGDFKTNTGFRLYAGDEDQPVDPLIASAVGVARASAHRGIAYAVFEGLQLADFGNRIPSLTFEVVADAAAPAIGKIAEAVAPEVEAESDAPLAGFAAGEGSVRDTLTLLAQAADARCAQKGGQILFRNGTAPDGRVADLGTLAGEGRDSRRERRIASVEASAREIVLRHYEAARDYQTGLQRARRPGSGERSVQVDFPAVMTADEAKATAAAMLARAEAERTRRTLRTDLSALDLMPGMIVTVDGEGGRWRITEARCEAMAVRLTLTPLAEAPAAVPAASGGMALVAADETIGATVLRVFETPALDEGAAAGPQITIAATGTGAGWRRAALLYSLDEGTSWLPAGATAAPAVIGHVARAPAAAPATLFDEAGVFEVVLARSDMMLEDADDMRMDAGANLARIGEELVQFGRAEPLDGGRWRLRRLLRGRRGTPIGGQAVGDPFVLIEADAVRILPLPAAAIGTTVRVLASGVGDDAAPASAECPVDALAVRPPSPIALSIRRGDDGVVMLGWTRRSRLGWRWIDGAEVPLGEEAERYAVTLTTAGGERVVETAVPWLTIAPGEAAGMTSVAVRQRGDFGESAPLIGAVPAI